MSISYQFEYSNNPNGCFELHPDDPTWYDAGATRIGIVSSDGISKSWSSYQDPSIRVWDGSYITVEDIIDLDRMPADFQEQRDNMGTFPRMLYFELFLKDMSGNSTRVGGPIDFMVGGANASVSPVFPRTPATSLVMTSKQVGRRPCRKRTN